MARKIIVTSALPYANGPIHIGHLVEYVQTDIWVRFQKMCSNKCYYFCADDTHGTPIMISANKQNIAPEELIKKVHAEHYGDFCDFDIEFDNFYSTHSQENQQFSEMFFNRLNEKGSITKKDIEQAYCENCKMFLPDRFIRGTCPRCNAEDQYGDSCDSCGGTYQPTELKEPKCATCGSTPVRKTSMHYFFKLADYQDQLKELMAQGHTHRSVANKLQEWFEAGLKDWDISRDGPYFGFKIPGEENKYFYVWLDAPIGYMASAENYCKNNGLDFDEIWPGRIPNSSKEGYEIYHFIGKDIMYFHALFWPAMLKGAGFKVANKLFVHGFLTVNGKKMSKSKGTFIKARTYLNHLEPEALRYYYAGKLSGSVEDIDLNVTDFVNRINSELVGKFANLASRSGPMLTKKLDGKLSSIDDKGKELIDKLLEAKDKIINDYETLEYASLVRTITALADEANKFVEINQPWKTIKEDAELTRTNLTTILNAVKILTTYLKPIVPQFAAKVEKFLNIEPLNFDNVDSILQEHKINKFERLFDRIEEEKVHKMIEESKDNQNPEPQSTPEVEIEPIADEITIDDFAKIDMRVAKVIEAAAIEGANKLLRLRLDIGGIEREVLAGIAKAYEPESLIGKQVIFLANLKPRKMRFGVSEGMILAAGPGGSDVHTLTVDEGAKPGQRIS